MLRLINNKYKVNFIFEVNKVKEEEKLLTLFYEIDRNFNKFIIQYYFNSLMGRRISVNNELHIPINVYDKPLRLSIGLTEEFITVSIDKKIIYAKERKKVGSFKTLALIGRPFFGKSAKTFLQFFYQASKKYIQSINFDYDYEYIRPKNLSKKNCLDKYLIKKSSANLINVLDKSNNYDYEMTSRFGEYQKITTFRLEKYLDEHIIQFIHENLNNHEFCGMKDEFICQINSEYSELYEYFYCLEPTKAELYLGVLYLNNSDDLFSNNIYLELANSILSFNENSKIALYIVSHIFLNSREYGPMLRVLESIGDNSINHRLYSNYFIFIHSISINKQIDYFADQIEVLIEESDLTNYMEFGLLVAMVDVLFASYHYSKRGFKFKKSIDILLKSVEGLSRFNQSSYTNFSVGILNMMAQRPKLAAEYFSKSFFSAKEVANYLLTALESYGNIAEARELLLNFISSTERIDPNDELVRHYTIVDNWINPNKRFDFVQFSDKEKDVSYIKIQPHRGLNFESIDNIYIADHDFSFRFKLPKINHDIKLFSYSDSLSLVILGKYLVFQFKNSINKKEIRIPISGLDQEFIEVSRVSNALRISNSKIENFVYIDVDEIIYGGRLIIFSDVDIQYSLKVIDYENKDKSNTVVIYSSWYGDEFSDLFFNSLVPSLKRPDALPKISKEYRVIWRIYTSEEQEKIVKSRLLELESLVDSIAVDVSILKSEKFEPREYLHETFVDCIKKSRSNCDIILFAPPDHIFGEGLSTLINDSKVDSYIICPHPRISYERVYKSSEYRKLIYKYPNESEDDFINNREMANLALTQYAHEIVRYGLNPQSADGITESSYWWSGEIKGSIAFIKFKEPPPVLLYARGDIVSGMLSEGYSPTFERVDHDLVEWMHKCNKLIINGDNLKFFWVEYCKDERNIPTIGNCYWPYSAQYIYANPHTWYIE